MERICHCWGIHSLLRKFKKLDQLFCQIKEKRGWVYVELIKIAKYPNTVLEGIWPKEQEYNIKPGPNAEHRIGFVWEYDGLVFPARRGKSAASISILWLEIRARKWEKVFKLLLGLNLEDRYQA